MGLLINLVRLISNLVRWALRITLRVLLIIVPILTFSSASPVVRFPPQRVQQGIYPIFALIGSPDRSPKLRGKAP